MLGLGWIRRRWGRGVLAFAGFLAFGIGFGPASASALTIAPPGHAGATQYFETVPTSSGSAAPPGSGTGSGGSGSASAAGGSGSGSITRIGHGRAGAAALARLGSDGRAAAALAAATAPRPVAPSRGSVRSAGGTSAAAGGTSAAAAGPGIPQGSSASALSSTLTGSDSGGLGVVLPLLLVLSVVAAMIAGVWRWRGSAPPSA